MSDALWLVVRAFVQVAPVAASTYFVSHDRMHYATAAGFLISTLWWLNASSAARKPGMRWALVYGTGAAMGTYCGQEFARWFAN